jgi:ribosomal protein S9
VWTPEIARLHMMAPVTIVGELREKYDVDISVAGGGFMSQADSAGDLEFGNAREALAAMSGSATRTT